MCICVRHNFDRSGRVHMGIKPPRELADQAKGTSAIEHFYCVGSVGLVLVKSWSVPQETECLVSTLTKNKNNKKKTSDQTSICVWTYTPDLDKGKREIPFVSLWVILVLGFPYAYIIYKLNNNK